MLSSRLLHTSADTLLLICRCPSMYFVPNKPDSQSLNEYRVFFCISSSHDFQAFSCEIDVSGACLFGFLVLSLCGNSGMKDSQRSLDSFARSPLSDGLVCAKGGDGGVMSKKSSKEFISGNIMPLLFELRSQWLVIGLFCCSVGVGKSLWDINSQPEFLRTNLTTGSDSPRVFLSLLMLRFSGGLQPTFDPVLQLSLFSLKNVGRTLFAGTDPFCTFSSFRCETEFLELEFLELAMMKDDGRRRNSGCTFGLILFKSPLQLSGRNNGCLLLSRLFSCLYPVAHFVWPVNQYVTTSPLPLNKCKQTIRKKAVISTSEVC